jgi:hypothetical protein
MIEVYKKPSDLAGAVDFAGDLDSQGLLDLEGNDDAFSEGKGLGLGLVP